MGNTQAGQAGGIDPTHWRDAACRIFQPSVVRHTQPIGWLVQGLVLVLQLVRVRLLSEAVSATDGAVNWVPRCPLCYIAQVWFSGR